MDPDPERIPPEPPCYRCGKPRTHYRHQPRVNDTLLPDSPDPEGFYHAYVRPPENPDPVTVTDLSEPNPFPPSSVNVGAGVRVPSGRNVRESPPITNEEGDDTCRDCLRDNHHHLIEAGRVLAMDTAERIRTTGHTTVLFTFSEIAEMLDCKNLVPSGQCRCPIQRSIFDAMGSVG
jgi:hypothetical protein